MDTVFLSDRQAPKPIYKVTLTEILHVNGDDARLTACIKNMQRKLNDLNTIPGNSMFV